MVLRVLHFARPRNYLGGKPPRFAMLVIGAVVWLVIIPAALLVREPGTPVEAGGRIADDGEGLSVGQALRTPQFAAIAITFFACCAAHAGPIFHMVSHAMDYGVAAMARRRS
jgi:hypothetical protein